LPNANRGSSRGDSDELDVLRAWERKMILMGSLEGREKLEDTGEGGAVLLKLI
jgi:hypothetical protein